MNTKLRLMFYKLSMALYRTWAVTLKREPVPLPHSLLSLLICNVFPAAPLLSFHYALQSHAFFRPFPPGLSAAFVRSACSALCQLGRRRRPTNCTPMGQGMPGQIHRSLGIVEDLQDALLRWGVGDRCGYQR